MLAEKSPTVCAARVPRLALARLSEGLRRWRFLVAAIAVIAVVGIVGSTAEAAIYISRGYHVDYYPTYGWNCWHGHCHSFDLGYYDFYPSVYLRPYLW